MAVQEFPNVNTALVTTNDGLITVTWQRFFQSLWKRTGGGIGETTGVLTGTVHWYGGTTVPTGYALCDGRQLSRTDFSNLFGVIGTTFGAGDGVVTFNVPNLVGKFAFGSDSMRPVGASGGAESVTLNTGQLPSHSHTATVTDPGHTHTGVAVSDGTDLVFNPTAAARYRAKNGTTASEVTGITVAIDPVGSGLPVPTIPPYVALLPIIRT
jgi:microcystin-dependent protein